MHLRKQSWEHVIANTDLIDLPIVAGNLTAEEVSDYAQTYNLTWVPQRGLIYGGYYKDSEGNCYYPA
jgi:hypothetical protein